jgi:hypothetical protein
MPVLASVSAGAIRNTLLQYCSSTAQNTGKRQPFFRLPIPPLPLPPLLKKSPTDFNNDHQAHRLPPVMPAKKSKASVKDAPSTTARGDDDDDNDEHRPKECVAISSSAPRLHAF